MYVWTLNSVFTWEGGYNHRIPCKNPLYKSHSGMSKYKTHSCLFLSYYSVIHRRTLSSLRRRWWNSIITDIYTFLTVLISKSCKNRIAYSHTAFPNIFTFSSISPIILTLDIQKKVINCLDLAWEVVLRYSHWTLIAFLQFDDYAMLTFSLWIFWAEKLLHIFTLNIE